MTAERNKGPRRPTRAASVESLRKLQEARDDIVRELAERRLWNERTQSLALTKHHNRGVSLNLTARDTDAERALAARLDSLDRTIRDTIRAQDALAASQAATRSKSQKADLLAGRVADLVEKGVPPKQIPDRLSKREVKGKEGPQPVSASTVTRAIARARQRGFLPPVRRRKIP